jgi:hypothetical protein
VTVGNRVLVTRAYGCLGSWVVRRSLAEGSAVVAFDRTEDDRRWRSIVPGVQAGSDPGRFGERDGNAARVRSGTSQERHRAGDLLRRLRRLLSDGQRFPPGSVSVGEPLSPSTFYGVYKAFNETTAELYAREFGVGSVGLRVPVVYGPGRDQGVSADLTLAMVAAARGERFRVAFGGTVAPDVAQIWSPPLGQRWTSQRCRTATRARRPWRLSSRKSSGTPRVPTWSPSATCRTFCRAPASPPWGVATTMRHAPGEGAAVT